MWDKGRDKLKISMTTVHSAVYILDKFMSNNCHTDEVFSEMYAVTSLLIASKNYEINPPKTLELAGLMEQKEPSSNIIDTERQILEAINWELESDPTFYSILSLL